MLCCMQVVWTLYWVLGSLSICRRSHWTHNPGVRCFAITIMITDVIWSFQLVSCTVLYSMALVDLPEWELKCHQRKQWFPLRLEFRYDAMIQQNCVLGPVSLSYSITLEHKQGIMKGWIIQCNITRQQPSGLGAFVCYCDEREGCLVLGNNP